MVVGALGQVGHRVQQHVVVVRELGNVPATTLLLRGVEAVVPEAAPINKHATLQVAQVISLVDLVKGSKQAPPPKHGVCEFLYHSVWYLYKRVLDYNFSLYY